MRGRSGQILFVNSLSATTPTPFETVYGPTKSFLTSFAHGLREELRGSGVSVTTLHPGATATDFHARAGMANTKFQDNSWKNSPALVAQQGYDAVRGGDASVIGGDSRPNAPASSTASSPRNERPAGKHASAATLGDAREALFTCRLTSQPLSDRGPAWSQRAGDRRRNLL